MKTDLPTPSKATKCYYCGAAYTAISCPNCGGTKKKRKEATRLSKTNMCVLFFGFLALVLSLGIIVLFTSSIVPDDNAKIAPSLSVSPPLTSHQSTASGPVFSLSAMEVVAHLQDSGLPIDNIVEYDENTDPNGHLGRPNRYIQKVNFSDARLEQFDESDPLGGTVEVFQNHEDAKARYDYIVEVSKVTPLTGYYCHLQGNILLRITFDITPSQNADYQKVFEELCSTQSP